MQELLIGLAIGAVAGGAITYIFHTKIAVDVASVTARVTSLENQGKSIVGAVTKPAPPTPPPAS